MINEKDLIAKKREIESIIDFKELGLTFDHFAIKVPDHKTYQELCNRLGDLHQEVFQSGRNIATVIGNLGTFEIMEPKETELIAETYLSHIGFVANNMNKVTSKYKVESKFEMGNVKGIFTKIDGNLVQFRNIALTDYRQV